MFERIIHWLIFLAIASFVVTAVVQLVTQGSISEPCCSIG